MALSGTGNIIGIVGYKGAGKTRVVEGLIAYLAGRGFAVGTVKHIDHDSSLQPIATDSKRHLDAGARTAVAVGESVIEILESGGRGRGAAGRGSEDSPAGGRESGDLQATVAAYLSTCDFVIVEGFKKEAIPKVALISNDASILDETSNVLAVISSGDGPEGIPAFTLDEVDKLGAYLLEKGVLKAPEGAVSLVVDGKPVRLNDFVKTSLAGVIRGFITSLRDVKDPTTVELRIRK
jgi:molybdopterin-guanine dinucleotide biosynthesis protein B